jgi:glutathione synthase/RimK-type ligase-like ATP-grasp enzyme
VASASSHRSDPPPEVALVTYRNPGGVPPEDLILADAVRRVGLSVAHPVWNDAEVDWAGVSLAVVRSTWDYFHGRPAFVRWVDRAGRRTDLWNRPAVLRWNTHKRYLRDLEEAGVPVVPTVWSPKSRPVDLGETMDHMGWDVAVVKPAVSGAGERTYRVPRSGAKRGQRYLAAIGRTDTGMVQQFLPSAVRGGERSLIFLNGRFSHCVRRARFFGRTERHEPETLARVNDEMRRVARLALAACPDDLLYARVDLIAVENHGWQVLEIELTEPSLFFVPCPRAAGTLARAIHRRLRR